MEKIAMTIYRGAARAVGVVTLCFVVASIVACGPTRKTEVRTGLFAVDDAELRQEKDGLVLEVPPLRSYPPEMKTTVQACNNNGAPAVDQQGQPIMADVYLVGGQINLTIYKLTISNNTDHVINLNRAVIRLFDGAGNQYEPKDADRMSAEFSARLPCATAALPKIKLIKLVQKSVEIVPSSSYTGYVAFDVPDEAISIPGIWKLALYEIPVETDAAGTVTKSTRFEVRSALKKFRDTYEAKDPFSPWKKISSEEVEQ